MGLVRKRIADGYVFKLIRAWLRAGIVENDMRTIPDRGTAQDRIVSPLLANIYLNDYRQKMERVRHREEERCSSHKVLR